MKKIYLTICITTISVMLAIAFTPKRVTSVSGNQQQSPPTREQRRQQELESKRESFKSGRDLLRKHGVPFDPDLLLEPGFKKKLAPTFATMREFQESRQVGEQIEGVELADILFLPEKVELTADLSLSNAIFTSLTSVVLLGLVVASVFANIFYYNIQLNGFNRPLDLAECFLLALFTFMKKSYSDVYPTSGWMVMLQSLEAFLVSLLYLVALQFILSSVKRAVAAKNEG